MKGALEWGRHDREMCTSREIKSDMESQKPNVVVRDPDTVESTNPYVGVGHHSGKQSRTFWACFMKLEGMEMLEGVE